VKPDQLTDFENAVGPHVEFLYRVAMALTGDANRAEDVVVATLEDVARSLGAAAPDRGLLLCEVYQRVSDSAMQVMSDTPFDLLPRSYRDAVLLASLPDVRLADVAAALGIPVDTVRTRRRRAFALMYRRGDENSLRA
jgi:DNA-directed RNA polymerase specialized sigma24 family protein